MTIKQLEEDSRISRFTWRTWIRRGLLPVVRLGRAVRVAETDYREFLERNRIPARVEGGRGKADS
jgi:excisionase family DNA binding protein